MAQCGDSKNRKRLCQNFRAILIGGFQADEREVQDAAWILCKHLFDYSERQRIEHFNQIPSIIDSAVALREVPTTNVAELHDWLFSGKLCDDESISLCIVAHSHGAKIAKDALHDERLTKYLESNNVPQSEVGGRIKHVRRNLAVITLGGIDDVGADIAEIALNIRFEQDVRSMVGEQLYGNEEKDVPVVLISGTKTTQKKLSKGSKNIVKTMFHALRLSMTGHTKHVLHDYVQSNSVVACIEKALNLSQGITCDHCGRKFEDTSP